MNTQPLLSYKTYELILNKCFEGDWNIFISIINYMTSKIDRIEVESSLPKTLTAFLDQLFLDETAYFQFMKLAIDRNPSLSDDLWVDNLTTQRNGENKEPGYENYFKVQTEFGMISIFPMLTERKHMRVELEKTYNLDQEDDLELPLNEEMEFEYESNLDKIEEDGQVANQLDEPKSFIDLLQKTFKPEKDANDANGANDANDANDANGANGANDANDANVHLFSKYFLQYCNTESDAKMEDKIFLVEELANCLYLQLDGTVPPPFTSIKAVRRDHTMHRLARYFFSKYTLAQISHVIVSLVESLQTEFMFNLLQEDRAYLHDSFLRNRPELVSEQMGGKCSPFNENFVQTLSPRARGYGFNKVIPTEEDEIQGNEPNLTDPLQKLIQADDNFRNLTSRQIEEWYETSINDTAPGWCDTTYMVDINPDCFNEYKGNIIFDYYLDKGLKGILKLQKQQHAN